MVCTTKNDPHQSLQQKWRNIWKGFISYIAPWPICFKVYFHHTFHYPCFVHVLSICSNSSLWIASQNRDKGSIGHQLAFSMRGLHCYIQPNWMLIQTIYALLWDASYRSTYTKHCRHGGGMHFSSHPRICNWCWALLSCRISIHRPT